MSFWLAFRCIRALMQLDEEKLEQLRREIVSLSKQIDTPGNDQVRERKR